MIHSEVTLQLYKVDLSISLPLTTHLKVIQNLHSRLDYSNFILRTVLEGQVWGSAVVFHILVLSVLQTNREYHNSHVLLCGLRDDFLGGWREKSEAVDVLPALVIHSGLGAA